MERKDFDRDRPDGGSREGSSDRSGYQGGGSSLESQMRDMGFTQQGGGAGQTGGSTGPKPYTGSQFTSEGFGSSKYVGVGKIAKSIGVDARELRSCAQSHNIIPDKTQGSCDMFTQDHAHQIIQACASGYKLG